MGIDYSAMLMYGVEVDSFEDAVSELKHNNVVSEQQAEQIIEDGEIWGLEGAKDILYQTYSYYYHCGGVLGVTLSLEDINTPALEEIKKRVDSLFPKSKCELHHFVQVY